MIHNSPPAKRLKGGRGGGVRRSRVRINPRDMASQWSVMGQGGGREGRGYLRLEIYPPQQPRRPWRCLACCKSVNPAPLGYHHHHPAVRINPPCRWHLVSAVCVGPACLANPRPEVTGASVCSWLAVFTLGTPGGEACLGAGSGRTTLPSLWPAMRADGPWNAAARRRRPGCLRRVRVPSVLGQQVLPQQATIQPSGLAPWPADLPGHPEAGAVRHVRLYSMHWMVVSGLGPDEDPAIR